MSRRHFLSPLRIVMCMLALAMVARMAIAPGYMPDAQALRDGRIAVALCGAGGDFTTWLLDLGGRDGDGGPSRSQDGGAVPDCPFGVLAHQAAHLPPLLALPGPVAVGVAVVPFVAHRSLPPLPAHGPPLGPRAPPSHLG